MRGGGRHGSLSFAGRGRAVLRNRLRLRPLFYAGCSGPSRSDARLHATGEPKSCHVGAEWTLFCKKSGLWADFSRRVRISGRWTCRNIEVREALVSTRGEISAQSPEFLQKQTPLRRFLLGCVKSPRSCSMQGVSHFYLPFRSLTPRKTTP